VLPAHLNEITLFSLDDGRWQRDEAGKQLPFPSRKLQFNYPTFDLQLRPGEQKTYWLRAKTTGSVAIEAALWDPTELRLSR